MTERLCPKEGVRHIPQLDKPKWQTDKPEPALDETAVKNLIDRLYPREPHPVVQSPSKWAVDTKKISETEEKSLVDRLFVKSPPVRATPPISAAKWYNPPPARLSPEQLKGVVTRLYGEQPVHSAPPDKAQPWYVKPPKKLNPDDEKRLVGRLYVPPKSPPKQLGNDHSNRSC
jgi:hypothetical protein